MSEATESDAIEAVEPGEVRVRRALLSVSDKRGLVEFAASRSSPPAAPLASWRTPASARARSRTTRASRRSSTAA